MIYKVLSLDMSSTATGWALFEGLQLVGYGVLKPIMTTKERKARYPEMQLLKLTSMAEQIFELVLLYRDADNIVIEEINRSKNRFAQKTLDGLHWLVLDRIWRFGELGKVSFIDSDGKDGWRSKNGLKLQLSPSDKLLNTTNRKLNKKLGRGQKVPIITQKTLSIRFANKNYGLGLTDKEDDIADAVGLGHFFVHIKLPELLCDET